MMEAANKTRDETKRQLLVRALLEQVWAAKVRAERETELAAFGAFALHRVVH